MVQHNSSSTQQFHKQVLEVDASQQTVFCVKKVNKRGFFCELENQTKKLGVQIPQNGKQKMFAYNWPIRNQEEKVEMTSYWRCPLWFAFGTKTMQTWCSASISLLPITEKPYTQGKLLFAWSHEMMWINKLVEIPHGDRNKEHRHPLWHHQYSNLTQKASSLSLIFTHTQTQLLWPLYTNGSFGSYLNERVVS